MKNKQKSFLLAESIVSILIIASLISVVTLIQHNQLKKLQENYQKMIIERREIEIRFEKQK